VKIEVRYLPDRAFHWWIYKNDWPVECFSWRWTAVRAARKMEANYKAGREREVIYDSDAK
jgi:hypothetical protein